MKFPLTLLLLALFAVLAFAAPPLKQVIISYPKDTPTSVLEDAMAAIREAVSVYVTYIESNGGNDVARRCSNIESRVASLSTNTA